MYRNFIFLLAILMIMISCMDSSSKRKNILVVGVPVEPVTLYPYGSNDNASARVHVNIFDRLIEKDPEGNFIPSLATDWEFISPTMLKMSIRENVKFHNGELLKPNDVKYSLERMIASVEMHILANPIKNVIVIDDKTIHINLVEPFAPILAHLAHVAAGILNEKAAIEADDAIDQLPIGTGAYKLQEWNRGQNVLLTKFDEYWDTPANIEKIEFRVIPEPSSRLIALETGDVDVIFDADSVDIERIKENNDLILIEKYIARIEFLGFNIGKGKNLIWKNPEVRQAISYAIDIQGIIDSIFFGAAKPADSIIYKTVKGYYAGLKPRVRDIEKARELLKNAGIEAGITATILTTEGARQKIAEVIQDNLKEIGFNISIQIYEWSRFLDATAKGEHDLFILGWLTVTGDADNGIYNLVHTSAFGGSGNRSFYSNPIIDRFLDEARKEQNPQKRNALYADIQKILYQECPIIPFFYKKGNIVTSKKVQNFIFDEYAECHRFNTVSITPK